MRTVQQMEIAAMLHPAVLQDPVNVTPAFLLTQNEDDKLVVYNCIFNRKSKRVLHIYAHKGTDPKTIRFPAMVDLNDGSDFITVKEM